MMAQAMQGRFRRQLPEITPEQVEAYYRANSSRWAAQARVQLKVITLKPMTDEPIEVLQQTAEKIQQELTQGATFEALAEQYNQEGSVDLGWLKLEEIAPEIQQAIDGLPVGATTSPIAAADGQSVRLVHISDRTAEQVAPLSQVRAEIVQKLRQQNAEAAYLKWIEELRAKFFVKVN
jgi:parvulin-like peptidyl-prolyl isomerase